MRRIPPRQKRMWLYHIRSGKMTRLEFMIAQLGKVFGGDGFRSEIPTPQEIKRRHQISLEEEKQMALARVGIAHPRAEGAK